MKSMYVIYVSLSLVIFFLNPQIETKQANPNLKIEVHASKMAVALNNQDIRRGNFQLSEYFTIDVELITSEDIVKKKKRL